MSNKILAVSFVLLCLVIGYATLARAEVAGKAVPVITQSFASTKVWPGETWKVYLNISDPDGEMKYIFATVEQPGVGQYPLSIIRVKGGIGRKCLVTFFWLRQPPGILWISSI